MNECARKKMVTIQSKEVPPLLLINVLLLTDELALSCDVLGVTLSGFKEFRIFLGAMKTQMSPKQVDH